MSLLGPPWDFGRVIAHRGSRILWPENTMLAFGSALDAGADHLETDLHLTADGRVVCFHDATVDRTTEGMGPVDTFTLSDLRRLDAGHRHRSGDGFPFRGRGLRVPTLGEVLATFPTVGVVVDLKQDGLEEALTDLVERMDAWHRVIVGSFSDVRLERMRRCAGDRVLLSTGPSTVRRWLLASRVGRRGPAGFAALQVPQSLNGVRVVTPRLVSTAHRHQMAVHVWTVNQRPEMERLWSMGVDGVITDRVDLTQP